MSNQIFKLNSVQSGAFSGTKNLLDFHLPAERLNLDNSYMNLVLEMNQVQSNIATGEGVYNYAVKWDFSNISVPNAGLVKNVRLTSDKVPILEDTRRRDVLTTQLHQYTTSLDEKESETQTKLFQNTQQGNIKNALGVEFQGLGSVKSQQNPINVQIPLNQIIELGKMTQYPGDKLGRSTLHCEMNFDKLTVEQLQGAGTRTRQDGTGFVDEFYTEFEDFAEASGDIGTSGNPFITKQVFTSIDQHPYWVNQKLNFQGEKYTVSSNVSVGTVNVETLVTNIDWIGTGTNKGKVALTTETRLQNLGSDEAMRSVQCDGVDAGNLILSVVSAEIVLEKVADGNMEKMDELQYSTFTNEGDNGNNLKSFSRMYSCEAEAFNLLVCPVDGDNDLVVSNKASDQFEKYRILIDNEFTTNRDVEYKSPLYYDQINKYLVNANQPLKSLNESNRKTNAPYYANLSQGLPTFFMGTPLPITPGRKQVQLLIDGTNATTGVNKLELFKQIVKQVKL